MTRRLTLILAAGVIMLAGGRDPAYAASSWEFLFSTDRVSDDTQLFLNLAVRNSGYPRTEIEPILPRLRIVEEDLPVLLFVANESHRSPAVIMQLRADGLGWSAIFARVGVPVDVLFVGIPRDPGPPYGKAWGHWRKHGRQTKFSDAEIASLAHLQIGYRVTGESPYEIARSCANGRSVIHVVAERKGHPGKGHGGNGSNHGRGNRK